MLFLSSNFPSVQTIIRDSVNAIGFQVAFYYSLAALACVWRFRHTARRSAMQFISLLLWPALSAMFLIFIAIYSVPTFDLTTNLVGIGGILIGILPYWLNRGFRRS